MQSSSRQQQNLESQQMVSVSQLSYGPFKQYSSSSSNHNKFRNNFITIVAIIVLVAIGAFLINISLTLNRYQVQQSILLLRLQKLQENNKNRDQEPNEDLQQLKVEQIKLKKEQEETKQKIRLLIKKLDNYASSTNGKSTELQLINQVEDSSDKNEVKDIKILANFLYHEIKEQYHLVKMKFLKEFKEFRNQQFLKSQKVKTAFQQLDYNFKSRHTNVNRQEKRRTIVDRERGRFSQEYPFKEQKPFCIVVPTVNNAKNYRYEYNLRSIYNLDYDSKQLTVVIVDDASTDNTADLIQKFLDQNPTQINFVLIRNTERVTALPNIHKAITKHCPKDSVTVLLDGDDELISPYSLKVFNSVYQTRGARVVYSNHIQIEQDKQIVYKGWSQNYPHDVKETNTYRQSGQKIAHLRSFKTSLYLRIKQQDLKDKNGRWFNTTYDEVITNPILEMSCGKIQYLQEYFYLYNFGIGTNDWHTSPQIMKKTADEVRFHKKKYQCIKEDI